MLKAHEIILWLAKRIPSADVYRLVKAAYFAEKDHIAKFGRPIIGDDYRAAPYGPLSQVIYGLIKHEPIDLLALGNNGDVQFTVQNEFPFAVEAQREPNLRMFSDSDLKSLEFGASHVEGRSFGQIVDETHSDPAFLRADGGLIDYRDMISDDDPDRKAKRQYIEESAPDTAL